MKFAEVLEIKNGKNQKQVENPNGKYPIYGSGGVMGRADAYICEADTVIVGRKGTINNPIYVDEPFWNVDTAFGLVANKELLLPKYLYYFCCYFDFESLNTTVTIPSLTKANLLNIEINIPSITEQGQVVGTLNKISELISLRKTQISKLEQLAQSRFIELFGDVERNENGLPTLPMTALCEIIDGDRSKNYPKQEEFLEEGFCLFLNTRNVTSNGFSFENCMYITEQKDKILRKGKLSRGDIVLTTRGTLGNLACYDESVPYDHMRINSGMVILRMKRELIVARFFMEQFKMLLNSIKEKVASGSAQPQLPISTMNKIMILVPDIGQQQLFADFVQQIDISKFELKQSLEKLEMLKKSLMQQYFG